MSSTLPVLQLESKSLTIVNLFNLPVILVDKNPYSAGGRFIHKLPRCPENLAPYIFRNHHRHYNRDECEMEEDEPIITIPEKTQEALNDIYNNSFDARVIVHPDHFQLITERFYRCFRWAQFMVQPIASLNQENENLYVSFWYTYIR